MKPALKIRMPMVPSSAFAFDAKPTSAAMASRPALNPDMTFPDMTFKVIYLSKRER